MRRLALALVAIAATAFALGCTSIERELRIACNTYTEDLSLLSIRNALGHFSEETQDGIDDVVLIVGPICRGTYRGLSTRDALAAVRSGLEVLDEAKKEEGDGV